jgi:hypothetical protein
MLRLIYVSSETTPFSEDDLIQLLDKARRNNVSANITGFLLYKNGRFMQLLEGPRDAVLALTEKIRLDVRHKDISILMEWEANRPVFSDWAMGFKRVNADTTLDVPGLVDYHDLALTSARFLANPSKALEYMCAASQVA